MIYYNIRKEHTMTNIYTSFDQLPISLNAVQLAKALGISRSNAYTLMHREDFPTIVIGKRMIVTKDKLLQWMEQQASA